MGTLRLDPTQTRGIEKRWLREINRRWSLFLKTILKPIGNDLTVNQLEASAEQIRIYMGFLQTQIDSLLLVTDQGPNWQGRYQIQSYERAITRSRAELRRQGANIGLSIEEVQQSQLLTQPDFTAVPSITSGGPVVGAPPVLASTTITQAPIHQEALEFLFTRSYDSLKGHTDTMARELRGILTDGVRQGKGIAEIKREIAARVDVNKSRARLIAQTETIQAYQRGQINQASLVGEEIGEEVNLRWLTRRDSKVRDLHARFHGQIMTEEEASTNINLSPFNCRCALAPVIEEADTPKEQDKFNDQRRQLLESVA